MSQQTLQSQVPMILMLIPFLLTASQRARKTIEWWLKKQKVVSFHSFFQYHDIDFDGLLRGTTFLEKGETSSRNNFLEWVGHVSQFWLVVCRQQRR